MTSGRYPQILQEVTIVLPLIKSYSYRDHPLSCLWKENPAIGKVNLGKQDQI